jgi:hypothetical protein
MESTSIEDHQQSEKNMEIQIDKKTEAPHLYRSSRNNPVLNISRQQHITNRELYGELPKVTSKIAARRLKLAGHAL